MSDTWRKDYNKIYRDKYSSIINRKSLTGVNTKLHRYRQFILTRTSLGNGSGTLLDVGCGIGIWSMVLSEWYTVVGVDNSSEGINSANHLKRRLNRSNTRFCCEDMRKHTGKYDVVFCRCPEFFSGYAPEHPIFVEFLPLVFRCCLNKLVLILYSTEPFGRYESTREDGACTSYYHNPNIIDSILSKYGSTKTVWADNRIVSEVILPPH